MKIKSLKEGPIEVKIKSCDCSKLCNLWYWDVINYEDFGLDDLSGIPTTRGKTIRSWERLAELNGWKNWKFV